MLLRCCLLLTCLLTGLSPAALAQTDDLVPLRTVLQETLRNNPDVQTAENDADIADRNASVGNAGFLPELSVQARYNETISDTEQQFQGQDPQEINGARTTNSGADAELSWRVFDGLGRFATLNRLRAERNAERQRARATTEQLLTDAALAYYTVVRAQRQRDVFEETVAVSEERVRIVELRNEVGSASDLEVRQARVDLNADRSALLRQEAALESAKAELNRVRGRRTTATDFAVAESIDIDETLAAETVQEAIQQANPVFQQAQAALQAAEQEQRALQANRLPALDATLGYGVSRTDSESGFVQQSTNYDLTYGLSLQFPLFTGFDRRRQRQNAQVRIRNAELAVEDVESELLSTLTQAYAEYQKRLEVVALETDNLEMARANVEVALEQFEVGDISSIELREVQEQAVRSESDLVRARFSAKQAELTLRELSGTTQADLLSE
ncbi:MAG: TolC family protein [Longimonas sp.]|uniref:TolC family protein n=1 Tax=Longimonas sp. TaxID=2039626 RepID=UPI003975A298